ncbi:hypothetical protein C8R47DRAFT_1218492 [Mycena vitilis]|nr:hypothetical protein C8R47DRAFT_1218492 [Mycena vitilis]
MSLTTLTFASPKILRSTIRSDDPEVKYTTNTVKKQSSRQTTTLEGPPGIGDAVIDWKGNTFEMSGSTRHISELRTKRATFSTSRYWSWFDEEEYKLKYGERTWTVYSYDGSVLATFATNTHRFFRDNTMPVIHMSPSLADEEERRFIILVLLYSETIRKDSPKAYLGV